jgi:hypothetical protein
MAPGQRHGVEHRTIVAWTVALSVVAVFLGAGEGRVAWNALTTETPSCWWPLHAGGNGTRAQTGLTSAQAGLIRCYLRALAHHDAAGLRAVAFNDTNRPVRITAKDFRYAADARSGVATATRGPAGEQSYAYAVTIVFADHVRETVAMAPVNPAVIDSWRLGIGTLVTMKGPPPGTNG